MNNSAQQTTSASPEVKMAKRIENERLRKVEFSYRPTTCRITGHSYETIDYIPDFDDRRYKILIQCTDCGVETFEKVNKDSGICGEYEYPTTSTLGRYWKKADEGSYLVMKQAFATEGIA